MAGGEREPGSKQQEGSPVNNSKTKNGLEHVVMGLCRKVLLVDTVWKLTFYAVGIILGSLLSDFYPLPKLFFSNKRNFLNVYFAKFSWGWTFLLVGTFTALSSYVYCLGSKLRVLRHTSRLLIGTLSWYVCTQSFVAIEKWSSVCVGGDDVTSKEDCLNKNLVWKGFDISGHSFLLIYCCLVLHEEAKALKSLDSIKGEERRTSVNSELRILKYFHDKFDLYVNISVVSITVLSLLWEFTLIGTVLYYHTLTQKLAGGLVATLAWFVTYRVWFTKYMSPGLPGQELFKYSQQALETQGRRCDVGLRPPLRSPRVRNNDREKSK